MCIVVGGSAIAACTPITDAAPVGGGGGGGGSADQTPPSTPTSLSATAVSASQVNLSWIAATDNAGVTGYGIYRYGARIATVATAGHSETTVRGSTTYSYTVDAFDAANNHSAPSTSVLVTTPAASADPVIAAVGDIACDPVDQNFNGGLGTGAGCQQLATSNLVTGEIDAALLLGDIQYECGGYQAYRRSYDLSWGRLKPIAYPAMGNHEFQTGGGTDCSTEAAGTKQYFLPLPNPVSGFPDQSYYSYNIGAWHVIALDSECAHVPCAAGSAQETWLRQDLAANTNACTVAYWHKPRWAGQRSWSTLQPLWSALEEFGVDLNLTGHEHTYQRFSHLDANGNPVTSGGIRQIIVGTGGKSLLGWVPAPGQEFVDAGHFGLLKLTLHAASYSWAFIASDGSVIDSGSDPCVSPPTTTTAASASPSSEPTTAPPTTLPPTTTTTASATTTTVPVPAP